MTKNITLAIDEAVLDRVRIIAAHRKTTVNALVREHLGNLARDADRLDIVRRELREISGRTMVDLGPDDRFQREDAYAGRMPGHQRPALRGDRKQG